MTVALVTVDTELSAGLFQRGWDADANFAASILGRTAKGDFGIGWQMDRLDEHGLKAIFFIDPAPALVLGEGVIARIVDMVAARGHFVELHMHSEWLAWADKPPIAGRGSNMRDLCPADQAMLIGWGRDMLERVGAPKIRAFRAGNFGADDATLAALDQLGLLWDSSYNPAFAGTACHISLPADLIDPSRIGAVTQMPVSGIWEGLDRFRPAQICALSAREMGDGLRHAADTDRPCFNIVTHSFEMLSRDRLRPNRAVMRRFVAMCETICTHANLTSGHFADVPKAAETPPTRLSANRWHTALRHGEQALATILYERRS
ncbi:MAG: polysaccharide deacetylase family protein [Sphingomonadaceae bacterium]|nr:polysaccharide deacetylase family protein [Sphingomonadaceae bacterium]